MLYIPAQCLTTAAVCFTRFPAMGRTTPFAAILRKPHLFLETSLDLNACRQTNKNKLQTHVVPLFILPRYLAFAIFDSYPTEIPPPTLISGTLHSI